MIEALAKLLTWPWGNVSFEILFFAKCALSIVLQVKNISQNWRNKHGSNNQTASNSGNPLTWLNRNSCKLFNFENKVSNYFSACPEMLDAQWSKCTPLYPKVNCQTNWSIDYQSIELHNHFCCYVFVVCWKQSKFRRLAPSSIFIVKYKKVIKC